MSCGCAGAKEVDWPRQMPDGQKQCRSLPPKSPDKRTLTDMGCCIFFLACGVGWIALLVYSFFYGNVYRLTHSIDYQGRLCGVDPGVENRPFIFFCGTDVSTGTWPESINLDSRSCVSECPDNFTTPIQCMRPHVWSYNAQDKNVELQGTKYERSYEMSVMQTVELGTSYRTQAIGRFCVPREDKDHYDLRNKVLFSIVEKDKLRIIGASFKHAWPVVLAAPILAALLGYGWLLLVHQAAGIVIFSTMIVGIVLLFGFGVFFFLALFLCWDAEDVNNLYNLSNPLVRSTMSQEGRFFSVFFGVVLIMFSVCLAFTTRRARWEIDRSVGIMSVALEAIFGTSSCCSPLISHAFMTSAFFGVWIIFGLFGFMFLCTVGYVDNDQLNFDGIPVAGLEAKFSWYPKWGVAMFFYACYFVWFLLFQLSKHQFAVQYAICTWWLEVNGEAIQQQAVAAFAGGTSPVQLNVGGTGIAGGVREGVRVKASGGQEVYIVPVGTSGPGTAQTSAMVPLSMQFVPAGGMVHKVKQMPHTAVMGGFTTAYRHHLGTLAIGSIVGAATMPFRLFVTAVRGLFGKSETRKHHEGDDGTVVDHLTSFCKILVSSVESAFLGMGKNAYSAVALSSLPYFQATRDATEVTQGVGGTIAYLYNFCALYEVLGVLTITTICSVLSAFLLSVVPAFADNNNENWYVQDTQSMVWICTLLSCITSYAYMSLVTMGCDTSLYVSAWARRLHLEKLDKDVPIQDRCPSTMKKVVPLAELTSPPDDHGVLKNMGEGGGAGVWLHSLKDLSTKATASMMGTKAERNPLLSTRP